MHLVQTLSLLSAALAVSVSAVPAPTVSNTVTDAANLAKTRNYAGVDLTGCKLDGVQLPKKGSGAQLPYPGISLHMTHAVLGRGTQNYTCENPGSTDAPKPIGAVAVLYDASCWASRHPSLLHEAADAALEFPQDFEILVAAVFGTLVKESLVAGHHYFSDDTTPVFYVGGETLIGTKLHSVPAPDFAAKGLHGAVPWLNLGAKEGSTLKEGYRMVTAGGAAPPTCEAMPASFEIDYAAEYYFFSE